MLIILPTYSAFNSALKSTNRAKEVTYAQTATQTVLEEIKYLGKSGVLEASQSATSTDWTFHAANATLGTPDYYTMTNSPSSGYVEGTEAYEVRVYFDVASYASNANAYQYSDLSDFAGECSEIINPEVSSVNYDTLAEEYFIRQYIDYKHSLWQEDWNRYEAAYLDYYDRLREYQQNRNTPGYTGTKPTEPTEPGAFTDPRDQAGYNEEAFLSCINKDQQLQVVPSPDGTGYYLSSVINYSFNNENTLGYRVKEETKTRTFSGFCEKAIDANTESLYVLYTPKDPYLHSDRDRVTIINGMYDPVDPKDINVFIVVQAPADVDYGDDTVGSLEVYIPLTYTNNEQQQVANHTENLIIHSQADLSFSQGQTVSRNSNSKDPDQRLLKISNDESLERISNVTVKILPFGTTATPGSTEEDREALATLTSTVVK